MVVSGCVFTAVGTLHVSGAWSARSASSERIKQRLDVGVLWWEHTMMAASRKLDLGVREMKRRQSDQVFLESRRFFNTNS
jgi:hypothetical protein